MLQTALNTLDKSTQTAVDDEKRRSFQSEVEVFE